VKRTLFFVFLLMFLATFAVGQRDGGIPVFGASDAYYYDTINLLTLVPVLKFPPVTKGSGALPGGLRLEVVQNCRVLQQQWTCGDGLGNTSLLSTIFAVPNEMFGMTVKWSSASLGSCSGTAIGLTSLYGVTSQFVPNTLTTFPFPVDANNQGTIKLFHPSTASCPGTVSAVTSDDSGYTANVSFDGTNVTVNYVTNASGWKAAGWSANTGTTTLTDTFGNSMTYTGAGSTFTDTLGAVLTLGNANGDGTQPGSFTYIDTTGTAQFIQFSYGSASTFKTLGNHQCVSIQDGQSVSPLTHISYPDGKSFILGWESNAGGLDGLINSVTLPTGGVISYTHGAAPTTCGLFYFTSLTRSTTADGTTTYSSSTSNGIQTTTVLDPGMNKSVYTFAGVSTVYPFAAVPSFLTSVAVYQNIGTVGTPAYTLLSNSTYCYNNQSCSTAPSYPITQRDIYEYIGAGSLPKSHITEVYDTYGNVTSSTAVDLITIPNQTVVTTSTFSGCGQGSTITDLPCQITSVANGNTVAQSKYTYNSSGFRTQTQEWTGSTWLITNYTPNSNGTTASEQDPNGQVVNYGYAATGAGGCNGLLPTSSSTTVNGIQINTSRTWDCNGGVVLQTTDANGNTPPATQYDALFRPTQVTDNLGFQVATSYTSNSVTVTPSFGTPNTTYVDTLGRPIINQHQQSLGSSNYDTVSTSYGWSGTNFQVQTSTPCSQTAGQPCPVVAQTSLVNPAFGPISGTDYYGGTVTYGRNQNDASVISGPHPSGEHTKTVQTEIDGLGRPKSVCALQTSGGTACGQAMGNSGVLTTMSYSFGTGSSTVTTTRGSQTHTTVSDAIGRPTSITLPETGSTAQTMVYDSQSTQDACTSSGGRTSKGDLLRVNNPDGTSYTCNIYDGIHRVTDEGNNGSNSTINPCRRFRYDAISNGVQSAPSGYPSSGADIVGRMVEAETDDCTWPPTGSHMLTDEWFAYDKDGRPTDMWEKVPNVSTYTHTSVTYNADGVVTALNIPNFPFTFGVDGESRPFNAQQGSSWIIGSSATTGITFDAASRPLTVPIGTAGDSDSYTYDSVGNMKTYTYSVNGKSMTGTLTWNPIGSLGSLAIVDGFNAGGSQTCSFSYDDVARLLTDNCGSVWSQTYDYGVNGGEYENLSKSGSSSWTPGYQPCPTPCNNHMLGSTYDSDGNVTYDGVNTYTWNVYGKVASTNDGSNQQAVCGTSGECVTYDAFGRLVEGQHGSSSPWVHIYSPTGEHVAWQATSDGHYEPFFHLPGGDMVYMSPGNPIRLTHYDWTGSSRITSTMASPSTVQGDWAVSPYGDYYDKFGSLSNQAFAGNSAMFDYSLSDTPNRELMNASGRWLSPDPAGASWNAYSYPTDPNTMSDPSGLGQSPDCTADATGCKNPSNNPVPSATGGFLYWIGSLFSHEKITQKQAEENQADFAQLGNNLKADWNTLKADWREGATSKSEGRHYAPTYLRIQTEKMFGPLAADSEKGRFASAYLLGGGGIGSELGGQIAAEEEMVTLYHGTTRSAASKILNNGFRGGPDNTVFFAEDFPTAKFFGQMKMAENSASSGQVLSFSMPKSLARDLGLTSRELQGEFRGFPPTDIAGGSGFERILKGNSIDQFNQALGNGQIVVRRYVLQF
jgi:RHS repeat-associated protein